MTGSPARHSMRRASRAVRSLVATLALVAGATVALPSAAHADDLKVSLKAFKPGGVTLIKSKTPRIAKVDIPDGTDGLSIVARGRGCGGRPPVLAVRVGGRLVGRFVVANPKATAYTAAGGFKSGRQNVSVVVRNPGGKGCQRRVRIDVLAFRVAAVSAAVPPAVVATNEPDPAAQVAAVGVPATGPIVQPTPASAPASSTPRLRWAPPVLESPTTIALNTGTQEVTLDKSRDYILRMPSTVKPGLKINGGRNVVLIGGSLRLATTGAALFITNSVGTVHVEGLSIDNSSSPQGDGIAIAAPAATVQIENTRIVNIKGSGSGVHGDIVQPWGGVKALRIDRLTGSTNCQGLFLRPDVGPIGGIELSNIDLNYNNTGDKSGGDLLWLTTGCKTAPTTLSDVHIGRSHPDLKQAASVWPKLWDTSCPAVQKGNMVTWPTLPVKGAVTLGMPAGGEYVPNGKAGPAYRSPGYSG